MKQKPGFFITSAMERAIWRTWGIGAGRMKPAGLADDIRKTIRESVSAAALEVLP